MGTTPVWQAATAGQLPRANQVNQLLGPHQLQILYTGFQTAAQSTAGSGGTNSNGLWLAQQFTTGVGQTAIGYVVLNTSATGAGAALPPTTVAVYANSGGKPSGAPLVSTTVTGEYVAGTPAAVTYPAPVTGLTASTTYWIVIAAAGDASHFYTWSKSNQVSGASTSANGTTWTAQGYGFLFKVFDQSVVSPAVATWEDGGARWVWTGHNANGLLSQIGEYTAGQTATGYCQTLRSLAYTSGQPTGVT